MSGTQENYILVHINGRTWRQYTIPFTKPPGDEVTDSYKHLRLRYGATCAYYGAINRGRSPGVVQQDVGRRSDPHAGTRRR